ncbi:MAG: type II secretion system protein GspE, partial [Myxococcaceae bacterium]
MSEVNSLWGKPIGEVFKTLFGINEERIAQALAVQKEKGGRLGEVLVSLKLLTNAQVAKAIAAQSDLPYVEKIEVDHIDPEILRQIPITFAKQNRIFPIGISERGHILLACFDASAIETHDELRL